MTAENYVKFLNVMASLYEQKRISKDVLTVALYPEGRLEYVLDDNYQDKNVITFCQQAKKIWADDPQTVNMFDAILSGSSQQGINDMRKYGGGAPPEVKIEPDASPDSNP